MSALVNFKEPVKTDIISIAESNSHLPIKYLLLGSLKILMRKCEGYE